MMFINTYKKTVIGAVMAIFALALLFGAPLSARASTVTTGTSDYVNTQSMSALCQATFPGSHSAVVVFPTPSIVGHKDPHEATGYVSLSAGTYKITVASIDSYNDRVNVSQPNEQWFLVLNGANGQVAETGLTTDLPDNVATAWAIDAFNNVVVSSSVTSATAKHIVYKGISGANSVQPVCAVFDKVSTPQVPAITGLVPSGQLACNTTSVNLSWNSLSNVSSYNVRVDDKANSWSGSCSSVNSGDLCQNSVAGSSYGAFAVTPGHSYDFWVDAGDNSGSTGRTSFSVPTCQTCSAPTITGNTSVTATVGQSFSYTATANSNGSGSNVTIVSSYLPSGITINGATISGTPTQAGTYTFTITARADCGATSTQTLTLVVSQQQQQSISGSCYPSPSYANTYQSVTWYANVSGGTGSYSYQWSDTNGSFGGNGSSASRSYSYPGTYSASVYVSSGNQATTIYCAPAVTIQQQYYNNQNLSVSCSPSSSNINVGQYVTWTPNVSGGQYPYQYSWYGSDGFASNAASPYRAYYSGGTQTAYLTVISADGQTRSATCSPLYVNQIYQQPLTVSCSASQTSITAGGSVTWNASVYGGTGSYSYSWNGTDGLYGYGASLYKSYSTPGTKTASVTVTSGNGQTVVRSCTPVIVSAVVPQSCNYLNDYLRIDWQNNPTEVRKLQIFLRDLQGYTDTPVTGTFDRVTFNNVSKFQTKYMGDVLSPWGTNDSTGFVYILTKKKVNEIYCQRAFPLTTGQQSEIDQYRAFVQSLNAAGIANPVTVPHEQQNTEDLFRLSGDEVGALFQTGALACRTDANGVCLPATGVAQATSSPVAAAFRNLGAAITGAMPGFFSNLRPLYEFLFILLITYLVVVSLIHRQSVITSVEKATFMEPSVLVTFIWAFGLIVLGALLFNALQVAIPFLIMLVLTVIALWVKHGKTPKVEEEDL